MQLNKNKKKIPLICKIFDPKMFLYDFIKWTGALPTLLFLRQKRKYVNGKKQKGLFRGSAIIVSNHNSFLDPIIVSAAFWSKRCGFIATKDLFSTKFRKKLFTGFGCIEVDKQNVSVALFKKTTEVLDRGHSIIIFPEGHVVREDGVENFKSGAILMAMFGNVPIIPMYIVKREKWWKRQHIVIGEKFYVSEHLNSPFPSMDDINRVTELLHEKELELEKLGKEVK